MRKDEFPIIDKHVKNEINAVLNKIRAEIEQERVGYPPSAGYYKAINKILQIIDKYRNEVSS